MSINIFHSIAWYASLARKQPVNNNIDTPSIDAIEIGKILKEAKPIIPISTPIAIGAFFFIFCKGTGA